MSSNGWYIIVNPSSGGGISKKKLTKISQCLKENNIFGRLNKTSPQVSAKSLVGKGIQQGFRRIICIGGDGTVHNLVNGILNQTGVNPKDIVVGLIPMGTGNDWARHHNIPTNYKKAISIIAKENVDQQDVGELRILSGKRRVVYFINYAGVGFDGYVISKIEKYKFLGPLSYLIAAIGNFISFDVVFECQICLPVEGMLIECKSKIITKAGIKAEIEDEDSPVVIFIARDHHYMTPYFSTISEDQDIKVRVIGQRFELNDKAISIIAELIEPPEVKQHAKRKPKLILSSEDAPVLTIKRKKKSKQPKLVLNE